MTRFFSRLLRGALTRVVSFGVFSRCFTVALVLAAALVPGAAQTAPSTTDQVIKFYQAKVANDPEDVFNYDRLSSAYVQKARESGDIAYYQLAQTGLEKSLALESKHEEAAYAFAELAAVYFAEHRFTEAAQQAQAAIAISPLPSAFATLGDARLEMGNYEEAATAYRHLRDSLATETTSSRTAYLSATRNAGLDWIHGQSSAAISELQNAAGIAKTLHLPPENIAWTHFMLAEELFQGGELGPAEVEAKRSLESYPNYHRALAEMAKIRAAEGRYSEAAALYEKAMAAVPLPVYVAALGDVYTKLGRKEDARKRFDLVETIARLSALSKSVYNRELAMFYADHDRNLAQALELVQNELAVRKDVYTWDALAWTLYKNGKIKEAKDASEHALSLGTKDALLYFHAGMIYRASGNDAEGEKLLREALALNPNFHVLFADTARDALAEIASHRNLAERAK